MLKKLDKYIIAQFCVILGISILGFLSIFVIVDLIENLDRFMDNKVSTQIVIKYYIYTLPYFISIGLPMAVLISTVFSLGGIVKRNEWTAIKASGISLYRIASPLIICGIILSCISFILDNKLVAYGNEKRFEIDRDYVKRKSRHKLKNVLKDIFLQKNSSTHISLSKYYIQKEIGYDFTMVDLGQLRIKKRIDAKKIIWNSDSLKWSISDYSIRKFDQNGLEKNVFIGLKDTLVNLDIIPNDIQQQARKPDELDYYRLTERIVQLKENGVDTIKWEVTRFIKISFAFTNLIVILCGIPLVVIKEKNSLSFGAGASVFVIFGYYALIKFGQSLGFKGVIEPLASAWIGNITFLITSIILFWRSKT
ncbi:MAG: LptF/LptG family permease [Candidatus Neomarinimicrobiota bacterium]